VYFGFWRALKERFGKSWLARKEWLLVPKKKIEETVMKLKLMLKMKSQDGTRIGENQTTCPFVLCCCPGSERQDPPSSVSAEMTVGHGYPTRPFPPSSLVAVWFYAP
jgi:hypothetical protein